MPGNLFHVGALACCPHGGQVTTIPTQSRVFVSSKPAATVKDAFTIAACSFNVAGGPHPCVKVKWLQAAKRVFIDEQPAILATNPALCEAADLAPQGAPIVTQVQKRVVAA